VKKIDIKNTKRKTDKRQKKLKAKEKHMRKLQPNFPYEERKLTKGCEKNELVDVKTR